MSRPFFDTTEYQRSHGKAPRGTGSWAFKVDQDHFYVFSPSMTFTEAKRWVARQNPEARTFTVGP